MTELFSPKELLRCADCPIRKRAVCAYCEPAELADLDAIKSYKTFAAGETMVWSGDVVSHFSSIVSGVATLSQTLDDGRRQMVGLLLPSDFIGRPGRGQITFDVEAKTEVTVCRFECRPFEVLLGKIPHLRERLLDMTMDDLDAAREWMLVLGRKTAREKIASFLAIVARRVLSVEGAMPERDLEFDVMLTREAMADYLGLTLETVSRQMNALKKDGVIVLEKKRAIKVPVFSRLVAETGDDTGFSF